LIARRGFALKTRGCFLRVMPHRKRFSTKIVEEILITNAKRLDVPQAFFDQGCKEILITNIKTLDEPLF